MAGLKWRVGDGCQILFWLDNWVPGVGILKNHAIANLSEEMLGRTVNYYLSNGEWLIPQLSLVLPWHIIHRVVSIHVGGTHSGSDKCIWAWDRGGDFTVKTAYDGLIQTDLLALWPWRFLWKLKMPIRVQHFLWILFHGKILTNEQRCSRGMTEDISCPRCHSGIENIDHLLRGCRDSIAVWDDICQGTSYSPSFAKNLDD